MDCRQITDKCALALVMWGAVTSCGVPAGRVAEFDWSAYEPSAYEGGPDTVSVVGFPKAAGDQSIYMMHLKLIGVPGRQKTGVEGRSQEKDNGMYEITINTTTGPIGMVARSSKCGDWKIGDNWFQLSMGNWFVIDGDKVKQLPVVRIEPAMIVDELEIVRAFRDLGY